MCMCYSNIVLPQLLFKSSHYFFQHIWRSGFYSRVVSDQANTVYLSIPEAEVEKLVPNLL